MVESALGTLESENNCDSAPLTGFFCYFSPFGSVILVLAGADGPSRVVGKERGGWKINCIGYRIDQSRLSM